MEWKNLYKYFSISIVVMLLMLGAVVIFSNYFDAMPKNFRYILGFFIIAYSLFRLINIIGNSKKEKDEEE
jgi:hypothetical protein